MTCLWSRFDQNLVIIWTDRNQADWGTDSLMEIGVWLNAHTMQSELRHCRLHLKNCRQSRQYIISNTNVKPAVVSVRTLCGAYPKNLGTSWASFYDPPKPWHLNCVCVFHGVHVAGCIPGASSVA